MEREIGSVYYLHVKQRFAFIVNLGSEYVVLQLIDF